MAKSGSRSSSGGSRRGSEVSTEPPFLAGYVINLIRTVKDPGFMEPPFLPFSYNKTGSSLPRQRF